MQEIQIILVILQLHISKIKFYNRVKKNHLKCLSTLRYPIYCYVKDGGIANKIFSLKKRQIYHHLF